MSTFQPIKTREKLPQLIFNQIKNSIISGRLRPGDKLPPERELVEQFKVSRIAVREGFKRLEASGLVMIKPGSGMFIKELTSEPMSESLSTILRQRNTSIGELTESRLIFEPSIARLAAERITNHDIRKLEENVRKASLLIQSRSLPSEKNIEFHLLVAEATHNTVISLTMKTFFEVLKEMTVDLRDPIEEKLRTSRRAVKYHKMILSWLRKKDPEKSCELMLEHIVDIQTDFKDR